MKYVIIFVYYVVFSNVTGQECNNKCYKDVESDVNNLKNLYDRISKIKYTPIRTSLLDQLDDILKKLQNSSECSTLDSLRRIEFLLGNNNEVNDLISKKENRNSVCEETNSKFEKLKSDTSFLGLTEFLEGRTGKPRNVRGLEALVKTIEDIRLLGETLKAEHQKSIDTYEELRILKLPEIISNCADVRNHVAETVKRIESSIEKFEVYLRENVYNPLKEITSKNLNSNVDETTKDIEEIKKLIDKRFEDLGKAEERLQNWQNEHKNIGQINTIIDDFEQLKKGLEYLVENDKCVKVTFEE